VTATEIRGHPDEQAGEQADEDAGRSSHYESPSVTYLGTLRELTLGGTSGPDDGFGGAGGIGSL
jgi:hypothetical protein